MSIFSRQIPAIAAAAAVLAGGSLLGAAGAAQAAPAEPYGTVVTDTLNIRQYPSTDSSSKGVLYRGEQKGLDCKVNAQNIGGNTIWYKLRNASEQWVSARHVSNHGHVPLCKDKYPTSVTKSELSQSAKG